MFSLQDFEQALDHGAIEVPVYRGARLVNYWRARRNGRTKTWKRDPKRWEVPCKAGLNVYFTVSNTVQHGIRIRAE